MIDVGTIEEEIRLLKADFKHDSYEYCNRDESFKECTKKHFNAIRQNDSYKIYGVYIVPGEILTKFFISAKVEPLIQMANSKDNIFQKD